MPLALYFKEGRAKLELGLGKGRTGVDKRQHIADRDAEREARQGRWPGGASAPLRRLTRPIPGSCLTSNTHGADRFRRGDRKPSCDRSCSDSLNGAPQRSAEGDFALAA